MAMNIGQGAHVLVADGRKGLLLRNAGSAMDPALVVVYGEEQPNPPDRDQKSDLQGRRPSGGGPGQSTTGETDYHQQTEDDFAVRLADEINSRVLVGEISQLVVAAAPKTLGVLRRHFDGRTQRAIRAEIDKDLTGYAVDRITQILLAEPEEV